MEGFEQRVTQSGLLFKKSSGTMHGKHTTEAQRREKKERC